MAPADRLLEAIAESAALPIMRLLSDRDLTQAALVAELRISQSLASRTIKNLRAAGIVELASPRGAVRLRAADEVRALLRAANNLADALIAADQREQKQLIDETRRTGMYAASQTRPGA